MTPARVVVLVVTSLCVAISGCGNAGQEPLRNVMSEVPAVGEVPDFVKAELLSLADAMLAAEIKGSWPEMADILAPEYHGVAPDATWSLANYRGAFAKIHLTAFRRDSASLRALAPGVVLLEESGYLSERYGDDDISGQYKFLTTWARRGGHWRLLVEVEIPAPATSARQ